MASEKKFGQFRLSTMLLVIGLLASLLSLSRQHAAMSRLLERMEEANRLALQHRRTDQLSLWGHMNNLQYHIEEAEQRLMLLEASARLVKPDSRGEKSVELSPMCK